jgi:hypothetical protein
MFGLTCFVRPHTRHQVLNNCSSSICFYRCSSVVGRGRAGQPEHYQQHCYHHASTVKPEAATVVVEHLMMGVRTLKTC